LAVITISRQRGSFGSEVAQALAQKLGFELITGETVMPAFLGEATAHERHMLTESAKFYLTPAYTGESFIDLAARRLKDHVKEHPAVVVGFGSQAIFAGDKDALHVRVYAPKAVRIARLKKQYRVSEEQAAQILALADRKQQKFYTTLFGLELGDASRYDLMLNTAALSVDECVAAIIALREQRALRQRIEQETLEQNGGVCNVSDVPIMKNQSEAEFARILDMYHIDWIYEPKTFPVEWDAGGHVISAFSPDFYLPKFDTYIELTTMNQKYVTAKNRKVKRLKELYPGINIKLVYKKDFSSLVERFNLSTER
jgi:cytidylate kinase